MSLVNRFVLSKEEIHELWVVLLDTVHPVSVFVGTTKVVQSKHHLFVF